MEDLTGIITQYGFAFQKKVFNNILLHNMNVGSKFFYEKFDDAAYEEKGLFGATFNSCLVQCKTGKISHSTLKHVIANWLISNDADKYILYLDTELSLEYNSRKVLKDIYNDIKEYIGSGKHNNKAVIYRIYLKFNKLKKYSDIKKFIVKNKQIISKLEIIVKNKDELESDSLERFISLYCNDLTIDFAKKSRYEMFRDFMLDELEESIIEKKAYEIDFTKYSSICNKTIQSITDEKYSLDYYEFRKNKNKILESYLGRREALFLRKIFPHDKVIAKLLTSELYYEDLRNHYIGIDKNQYICGIEENAHCNYLMNKDIYGGDFKKTFTNTLSTEIDNIILINKEYREGCYIFLSSDDATEGLFIDWCGENAKD